MAKHLFDPEKFGGEVSLISLSRNDSDFDPSGKYWRGSLWLPLAYITLKGLVKNGFYDLAHNAANCIVKHMLKTYEEYEPHSIWECYSPTEAKLATQANGKSSVRKDFYGWSALGPISIYLEFVPGFYEVNAFEKVVKWAKPKETKGKVGIKNLCFGNISTDIIADDNTLVVVSEGKYTLELDKQDYYIKK